MALWFKTSMLLTWLFIYHPATWLHSIRVSYYADQIGKELWTEAIDLRALRTAALLHDIGKIMIPKKVLKKRDSLMESEYKMIKRHVEFGYQILKNAGYSEGICEAVRDHHERADGKGYQYKTECSLPAAIISVADCYDVMKHGRSYQKRKTNAEITIELCNQMGKQFQTKVAMAALWSLLT